MNTALIKYKKKVLSHFGKISNDEQQMISAFFNSIEDYPNIDTFSYDELTNHFGKPEDIFCTYIKDSDESVLIKKHKSLKQKKLKLLILIVLLSLIFISAIFLSYSQSKNSYINREKIEITQDE